MKIYLAGPDVFRYNALEHFLILKNKAKEHGHIAFAPLDNDINIKEEDKFTFKHALEIFKANIHLIDESDAVLANIQPFRGACADDGTAFEIGYAYAKGKRLYGYSHLAEKTIVEITPSMFNLTSQPEFPMVENFGSSVNLMLSCSIEEAGGKIFKTYEECLVELSVQ